MASAARDEQADRTLQSSGLAVLIEVVEARYRCKSEAWSSRRSRWLPLKLLLMADSPYLLAIALFEQNGKRAMPLGGRSLPKNAMRDDAGVPAPIASELALELLLRVWQRSDQGPLQRDAGPESLLMAEVGMEHLPEALPLLKATWLTTGDSAAFRRGLLAITSRCWSVSIAKFEPIAFTALEGLPLEG